jgi:hypothetical protein
MSERDEIARALLAEALRGGTPVGRSFSEGGPLQGLPAAQIASEGASPYALPNMNVELETRKGLAPRVSGGLSTPLAGGNLGLTGSYYQPAPTKPTDWSTMLRYQRRF